MARHGQPGAEAETFAAIDAVRAIAGELDLPMANVALAWVIAQPGLVSAIAGARRPEQIVRNVGAAAVQLPASALARLDAATETLKQVLGSNADYWHPRETARTR
jgi:aryl-alcohol dehydrogenase-like predicted oxidoreductase